MIIFEVFRRTVFYLIYSNVELNKPIIRVSNNGISASIDNMEELLIILI